ncbi:NAD-dependent malic enzyme, partial [Candidatus Woesearchaeota archaeon]|nr:NAD-dependent malic enzyme [Candidatus Woesearchaeota archaeon]
MNYQEESLRVHEEKKGKIAVRSKVKVETKDDLSLAYTPGVAEPCRYIAKNKEDVYKYTFKGNSVAVISDGSAVLGLGNIGAEASLPVMEGKAILFKEFADIDAFPICLASQDVEKNIETIKNIVPVFGGINLEDFKAPQCFEIEAALQDLGIPVMHDDQHGTAVVVMAAMINALKVVGKNKEDVKVIVNGAGAAGIAVTKLLVSYGISSKNVILCDSKGTIYSGREDLENNKYKKELAEITNSCKVQGNLSDAIKGADVFLGVSKKGLLKKEMVESMNKDAIVLAMANPDPEIMPDEAKEAGARVIATGRSDFPNQVNNVLGFPGIFRGALDVRAT